MKNKKTDFEFIAISGLAVIIAIAVFLLSEIYFKKIILLK